MRLRRNAHYFQQQYGSCWKAALEISEKRAHKRLTEIYKEFQEKGYWDVPVPTPGVRGEAVLVSEEIDYLATRGLIIAIPPLYFRYVLSDDGLAEVLSRNL